jgi:hypothetical protein
MVVMSRIAKAVDIKIVILIRFDTETKVKSFRFWWAEIRDIEKRDILISKIKQPNRSKLCCVLNYQTKSKRSYSTTA